MPEWVVIYKAVADFSDLTRKSAEALAELEALKKAAEGLSSAQLAYEPRLVAARAADIKSLSDLATAMDVATAKAAQYNKTVLWEGASSGTQYLANLQQEKQLLYMLNIQKQRGFYTPYQDYAFRNQEIAQMYLFQRASQAGYATPDQYLQYLSNLRNAMTMENQAWRDRVSALAAATNAQLAHDNSVTGLHLSAAQLLEGTTAAQVALATLGSTSVTPSVGLSDAQMRGAVALDEAILGQLGKLVAEPKVTINDGEFLTGVAAIEAGLAKLAAMRANFTKDVPIVGAVIDIMRGGTGSGAGPPMGSPNPNDAAAVAAAALAWQGLSNAEQNAKAASLANAIAQDAATAATAKGGMAAIGAATGWGGLGTKLSLMGGLMGSVALWHLGLDAIIETLAILVPALITMVAGLGAFIGVGNLSADTLGRISDRLKAVYTTSSATGQAVYPMTNSFNKLQTTIRPEIWQLYGDALQAMSGKMGMVGGLAESTGAVLDRMGARVVVDIRNSGTAMQHFLQAGARDLAGIGSAIDNLSHFFMSLILVTEKTHIAEDLLGVVDVLAQLLGMAGSFMRTPVGSWMTAAALGAHGLWLWGGLAVTGLQQMALWVARLAGSVPALSQGATSFAQAIGASNNQLAQFGKMSPNMERVAQGIANGQTASYQLGQSLGITDQNLVKIVAKQPQIQAVADSLGTTAANVAQVAIATSKSSTSLEELARNAAGGEQELAALELRAGNAGKNVADLAVIMGGDLTTMDALAAKSAGIAGGIENATQKTGLLGGAIGLVTKFWPVLAIAAAVGLGVVIYKLLSAKDATQQWIDSLNAGIVGASNVIQGYSKLIDGMTATNAKLQTSYTNLSAAAKQGGIDGAESAKVASTAYQAAGFLVGIYGQKVVAASQSVHELTGEQTHLVGQLNSANQFIGEVANSYGVNFYQALGYATLAQVKFSDILGGPTSKNFQIAIQQVASLVAGYDAMGQGTNELQNDVSVLLVTSEDQLASMQKLNQAWDQFTQLVAGPVSTFLTLDQSMMTFSQDALQAGATMTGLGQNIVTLSTTTAAATPTISNAAIQLQQQFQTVYSNAEQMFDAMRNSQAVTGVGNFTKFVKDAVAALIPLAGTNKAAAAEISSLAQEAGGPATTNLAELAKWAGNVKHPMMDMQTATDNAAIAMSNLSQDASKLTSSILSDMTALEKTAVEQQVILPAMNAVVVAIEKYGAGSLQTAMAQDNLYNAVKRVTGSQSEAESVVNLLTGATTGNIYITTKTADAWDQLQQIWTYAHASGSKLQADMYAITQAALIYGRNSPQYEQALKNATDDTAKLGVEQGNAAKLIDAVANQTLPHSALSIEDWAKNALGYGTQEAGVLAVAIQQELGGNLNALGNLTLPASKNAFINWAKDGLQLSQGQAYQMWQQMVTLQLEIGDISARSIPASKSQFIDWAENGLNASRGSADNLWAELTTRLGPTLDGLGSLTLPNAKQKFIDWAENGLHLSQTRAYDLWSELVTLQNQIDQLHGKDVTVGVTATGSGGIKSSISGLSGAGATQILFGGLAAGGAIGGSGGPRQDNVPIMASTGEWVINAESVRNMQRDFGPGVMHNINSYASGGEIDQLAATVGNPAGWETTRSGIFARLSEASYMKQAIAAFKNAVATAGLPGSISVAAGSDFQNLMTLARYLMAHGATRIAASGIAGDVYGESSGDPEAVGSGGFGLIGWTGNTIGLPPGYYGPTGNPSYDLSVQIPGVLGYIDANGGLGPINAAQDIIQAGDIFSIAYERPLVNYSDTRPLVAAEVYAALGGASASQVSNLANTFAHAGRGTQGGFARGHAAGGPVGWDGWAAGGSVPQGGRGIGGMSGFALAGGQLGNMLSLANGGPVGDAPGRPPRPGQQFPFPPNFKAALAGARWYENLEKVAYDQLYKNRWSHKLTKKQLEWVNPIFDSLLAFQSIEDATWRQVWDQSNAPKQDFRKVQSDIRPMISNLNAYWKLLTMTPGGRRMGAMWPYQTRQLERTLGQENNALHDMMNPPPVQYEPPGWVHVWREAIWGEKALQRAYAKLQKVRFTNSWDVHHVPWIKDILDDIQFEEGGQNKLWQSLANASYHPFDNIYMEPTEKYADYLNIYEKRLRGKDWSRLRRGWPEDYDTLEMSVGRQSKLVMNLLKEWRHIYATPPPGVTNTKGTTQPNAHVPGMRQVPPGVFDINTLFPPGGPIGTPIIGPGEGGPPPGGGGGGGWGGPPQWVVSGKRPIFTPGPPTWSGPPQWGSSGVPPIIGPGDGPAPTWDVNQWGLGGVPPIITPGAPTWDVSQWGAALGPLSFAMGGAIPTGLAMLGTGLTAPVSMPGTPPTNMPHMSRGGPVVTFGDINIHNPRPEASSGSITHATHKAAFMAGRQLA